MMNSLYGLWLNDVGVFASSFNVSVSGEGEGLWLLAPLILPLIVFALVYFFIYRYYRNTDKRFNFEHETVVEIENMQAYDRRVGTNNGTKQRRISGDNSKNHLKRVGGLK